MGTKVAEFSKSGPKSSQKQFLLKSKCFSKEPKTLPNVWATFLRNLAANTFQKLRYLITLFKTPIGMAPPSFVVLEWAFLISRLFSKIDKPPPPTTTTTTTTKNTIKQKFRSSNWNCGIQLFR